MQTVKSVKDGKTVYAKPKGYQPAKHSHNRLVFAVGRANLCRHIWELGQTYYRSMQQKKGRSASRFKHPVLLVKLFYYYYLTGSNLTDPIREPKPRIHLVHATQGDYIKLQRIGQHGSVEATLPILDEYEAKMWNFVTDSGELSEGSQIFGFGFYKSVKGENLAHLLNKNFRTELRDTKTGEVRKLGLLNGIMRRARVHNLVYTHRVPLQLVYNWIGTKQPVADLVLQKLEPGAQMAAWRAAGFLQPKVPAESSR